MENETPQPPSNRSLITWGPTAALFVAIGVYIAGQIIGGIIILLYPASQGWSNEMMVDWLESSTYAQFFLMVLVEGITLLLLYTFIRYRRSNYRALGLTRPKWRDLGYALAGYGVYFVIYIAIVVSVRAIFPSLNVDQEQMIGFDNAKHGIELILVFISLVILPPITEEIVMRGFLYPGLRTSFSKLTAALITSGLFAAAHLQFGGDAPLLWVAALDTFILSLVLIHLRDKTGRLWAPITLHAIKNGVAFFVLFIYPLLKLQ